MNNNLFSTKTSILLIALLCVSFSFSQNKEELLVGSWKFDYDFSFEKLKESDKQIINKTSVKVNIRKIYEGKQFLFFENKTFRQILNNGVVLEGVWLFVEDKNNDSLVVQISDNEYKYLIETITPSVLVLKPTLTGKIKNIFPLWYFTRL